ncbi:anti-sigma factor [Sphingomonas immobilis]|uniref:Anti-sigma factor n=1 Tax=Sphingomonas immobilis TaxID=3063997 RepID=A0ABT9A1Z8_9SPHN|nr:anti-sigma factor [Sphingomonas sp. CA1-15]MDO7843855.1 anti-sigma factor [Sphingomonas sp. CA1-15]
MSAEEGPDVAAAELALGLLEGEERAVALRRVLAEPGFAGEVEVWRGYLGQLFDLWPEAAAPAGVFERVERTLDAPAQIASVRAPARFWPALAGLTSIAAAAALVFIVVRPNPLPAPPPPVAAPAAAPMLVASLAPMDKSATAMAAVYDPARGQLRLTEASAPAANRSAELWVIGDDKTPHSLGMMKPEGGMRAVAMPMRAHLAPGAMLAVTIEPLGGSPSGKPTGPIVAMGKLSTV